MEFVTIWIICAVITAIIASSKGRSGIGWLLVGAVLGIFGVILIACLPSLRGEQARHYAVGAPTPETHVKCPDCRELVLRDARKCKHCGSSLIPQGAVETHREVAGATPRWLAPNPVAVSIPDPYTPQQKAQNDRQMNVIKGILVLVFGVVAVLYAWEAFYPKSFYQLVNAVKAKA